MRRFGEYPFPQCTQITNMLGHPFFSALLKAMMKHQPVGPSRGMLPARRGYPATSAVWPDNWEDPQEGRYDMTP